MKKRHLVSFLMAGVTLLLGGLAQASLVGFSQQPDMVAGTDALSMHRAYGPVVVDDFIVSQPEITGFRWWGSYFGAAGQSRGQARDVQFELSLHTDCLAGAPISPPCPGDPRAGNAAYSYSTPGQPYQFQILNAQETYFGTTAAGEDVYEYFVLLTTGWAATPGAIGWVDIAWAAGQFGTVADDSIWGWHESDQHTLDWAVQTDSAANSQLPLGGNSHLGPWDQLQGKDMAFEVITVPEPGTLALAGLVLCLLVKTRRGRA